jgi:hypothetical protein
LVHVTGPPQHAKSILQLAPSTSHAAPTRISPNIGQLAELPPAPDELLAVALELVVVVVLELPLALAVVAIVEEELPAAPPPAPALLLP